MHCNAECPGDTLSILVKILMAPLTLVWMLAQAHSMVVINNIARGNQPVNGWSYLKMADSSGCYNVLFLQA